MQIERLRLLIRRTRASWRLAGWSSWSSFGRSYSLHNQHLTKAQLPAQECSSGVCRRVELQDHPRQLEWFTDLRQWTLTNGPLSRLYLAQCKSWVDLNASCN